ncbi:unknown [Clostridium sp. CAG:632]|nr:unknown [Clostridium sp. CAG:632]
MIANHISLPWLSYCGSLLLFSIFFVVKPKIQVQSLLPSETKTRKLIPTILIALLLYQIVSYGLICLSTTSEPLARLLQNLPLGFLLNLQLIAGYLIGLLLLIITYIRSINQQCKTAAAPLLANGLVHLCLIYSDLLHRLTDVSQFAGHYALGTGLVVIIILITLFL